MRDRGDAFEVSNPFGGSGFPLYLWRVSHGREDARHAVSGELHWHNDLQLTLVEEGEVRFDAPACHTLCTPGELVFINSGVPHRIVNDANGSYLSCVFPPKMLGFFPGSLMQAELVAPLVAPGATPTLHISRKDPWHAGLLELMEGLAGVLTSPSAPPEPARAYEAAVTIVRMWLVLMPHLSPASMDATAQRRASRLQGCISFIDAHYAEPLTLLSIAQSAHVSPGECGRCFKDSLGITPYRYLMDVRLEHARARLADESRSITQIALECGFGSTSHFDNAFKARMGVSPRELRRSGGGG